MTEQDRLKIEWFERRSRIHARYRLFLIEQINQHYPDFPLSNQQLIQLPYEDLGELAVAAVNRSLNITLGKNQDYHDGSDKKCVIGKYRNNNIANGAWTHSYAVTGTKNKAGALRVTAYNEVRDDFDFFYFPKGSFNNDLARIEVVIERYTSWGEPEWMGHPANICWKWWDYRCDSFEEMALAND